MNCDFLMLSKECSTNLRIRKIFANEIIEEQYNVLGYYILLAFPVHKLGLEIDEKDHIDRSEAKEKEKQKSRKRNWFHNN